MGSRRKHKGALLRTVVPDAATWLPSIVVVPDPAPGPVPLRLPGVTGPVLVRSRLLGRPTVLVDGRPARRVRGSTFELNSRAGRPLRATVAPGRWMSPYPRLLVEGEVYETGPAPPVGLQLLAVVPGLAIFLGGLGMFLAVAGLVASVAVLRRPWPLRARFAGVLAVVAVTAALGWVIAARVEDWI